jgi:hypothetical protein
VGVARSSYPGAIGYRPTTGRFVSALSGSGPPTPRTPTRPAANLEQVRLAPLAVAGGSGHPEPVDQEDDWGCVRGAVASILGLTSEPTRHSREW